MMSETETGANERGAVTGIAAELPRARTVVREPLWIPAWALFGVGDILTTLMGFTLGAVETSPLPARVLGDAAASVTPETILTLLTLKALAFVLFAGVWALFPVKWFGMSERWRVAVPGVLCVFGAAVVAHNSLIIHTLSS